MERLGETDVYEIIKTGVSIIKTVSPVARTLPGRLRNRISRQLCVKGDKDRIDKITKHYIDIINKVLDNDILIDLDHNINHVFDTISRLLRTKKIITDDDFFNQLIMIINFLYKKINVNYVFNTLNRSSLDDFNKKSIWMKVSSLIKKNNESFNWCSCRHYALLFKHILDELENRTKIWISNYLFIEKTDWLNHVWLVVSFNWKNYLLDSSFFNHRFIQGFDDLWEAYERMHELPNFHKDSSDKDTEAILLDYKNNNTNYSKVCINSSDDLIYIISSLTEDKWVLYANKNTFDDWNIIDKLIWWISFEFFWNWILFSDFFFYYFNNDFNVENVDNLENENLLKELINNISYKIDAKWNRIWIFKFEKEYLIKRLLYFSDKIDYDYLRKILKKTKNITNHYSLKGTEFSLWVSA